MLQIAPRDLLRDPPHRIGREAKALLAVVPPHSLHQADVAFLDQVEQRQSLCLVSFGNSHHEAKVALRHLGNRLLVVLFKNAPAQLALLFRGQPWISGSISQIDAHQIVLFRSLTPVGVSLKRVSRLVSFRFAHDKRSPFPIQYPCASCYFRPSTAVLLATESSPQLSCRGPERATPAHSAAFLPPPVRSGTINTDSVRCVVQTAYGPNGGRRSRSSGRSRRVIISSPAAKGDRAYFEPY